MSRRESGTRTVNALLVVAVIGILLPIYWLVKSALSTNDGLFSEPPQLFPSPVSVEGFTTLWATIAPSLVNSMVVAIGTVVLTLAITVPTAYGLFLLRDQRGGGGSRFLVLLGMAFPSLVFVIPLYQLLHATNLLNTVPGLIIADTTYAVPLAVMLMYTYMLTLPGATLEAAVIDGAGPVAQLFRIVVPLITPSIATSAIFAFLFGWNDFLFSVTFGAGRDRTPATVAVYSLIQGNNGVTAWPQVMAGSVILAAPAMVALLFAQRFIRSGLGAGAVK